MTCKECERIQNIVFDKRINKTIGIAYVRIDKSDIAVIGCNKHVGFLKGERFEMKEIIAEDNWFKENWGYILIFLAVVLFTILILIGVLK